MEYARVKVFTLRRKLCEQQKGVLELAYKNNTTDYNHPAVNAAYQRAIITEHLLEEWTLKYKEEYNSSFKGLNNLE